ncbi:DUF2062 domain-containing protein [Thiohalocapsa marina]|uniref:DUF2062 domain-containing protein n=1 Tax=Thiohalocapsa marina TaxID=424902 RepID=UPI0036DC82B3
MPDPRQVVDNKCLGVFGNLLHDPNLWHINRHSASGAVALGLFVMYLPPIGQMFIAAAGAIRFRVNLPISVSLVWISNPLTIPPMFYLAYAIGAWILGRPIRTFEPAFWLDWHNWFSVMGPLLLGSLICATACAAAGYVIVQGLWRWSLMRQIRLRRKRYAAARVSTPSSRRQI